jgi:bifunctional non-homologous end joining protein LigD
MARRPARRTRDGGDSGLAAYREKRRFDRTPEPAGDTSDAAAEARSFVVQKHAARRVHFDFRLSLGGVFKSWAVTRGPSLDPKDVRLAVHVEDHPLEYGDFEGVIPRGEYGGGTVMIWDRGTWDPLDDPEAAYGRGRLSFVLHGERLRGRWLLFRTSRRGNARQDAWLLRKSDDDVARPGEGDALIDDAVTSVVSARTMEQIAADRDRVWHSNASDTPTRAADPDGTPAARALAAGGVAAPMPQFVPPQLASPAHAPGTGDNWLHEIKFDGYRLQLRRDGDRVALLTRKGLDWADRLPAIRDATAFLPAQVILDGEAAVMDEHGRSRFGDLQAVVAGEADLPVHYWAFDCLYVDGIDLMQVPLVARKAVLAALLGASGDDHGVIRYVEHLEGRGPAFLRSACRFALEGVISKKRDAPYRSGRGRDWLKSKCLERQEFVIGGFTVAAGAPLSVAALLLGYHDGGRLHYAGKVGTGFSRAQASDLAGVLAGDRREASPFAANETVPAAGVVWTAPRRVCEIEFSGWTDQARIRHGVFKGLREDKPPREVTREIPGADPAAAGTEIAEDDRSGTVRVAGVALTHPDRVLYPEQALTKRGLAEFMSEISEQMLPHVVGRPLSLVRCPRGRQQKCFYQKHAMPGFAEEVRRVTVSAAGKTEDAMVIEDVGGLAGC